MCALFNHTAFRSSLGPTVCIFASSQSPHMLGGLVRSLTVYNYALTREDVAALGGVSSDRPA